MEFPRSWASRMSIEKDGAQVEQLVKFLQPVAFDEAFAKVLSQEVLPKAVPEFKKSTEDGGLGRHLEGCES